MLLVAITRGRLYQVKFLLESGSVNVNITDHNGQTPLMKAILLDDKMHHTRYKIVRLLLDHGAKVNLTDKGGKTALMLAVIRGQKEIAERILKCSLLDIDLNAEDYDGNTALIHAALEGHEMITSILITSLKRFGLGVDKKNHRGFTAMLEAVRYGQERCAQVLYVEGSASLTIRDPEKFKNAQEWAAENQLFNLVELIEKTKQEAAPSKSPKTSDDEKPETSNLELPMANSESGSRPLSARDVNTRPPSRKTSTGSRTVTVARVMRNLRSQEESAPVEIDTSRIPSPKELIQDKGPYLVAGATLDENEGKGSRPRSCAKSSSSLLLTKRRSPKPRLGSAGSLERCSSAKIQVQRLLSIYGIQNSITYRKGYDPTTLPPSGMWPDPNAVSLSDACENVNAFGEMDFFSESPFGLGRRSVMSSASLRRTSVVGGNVNTKEGRKMSIISQGNPTCDRRIPVMGRKFSTIGQPPPTRNMLEATFGRSKPGERRMSMAQRPNMERPTLKRMATSLSPLVD